MQQKGFVGGVCPSRAVIEIDLRYWLRQLRHAKASFPRPFDRRIRELMDSFVETV